MSALTVAGTVDRDNKLRSRISVAGLQPKGIDMNSTVDQLSNDRVADVLSDAKDGARGELRRFFDDVEELLGRVSYINDVDLDRLKSRVEKSMSAARDSTQQATRRVRDLSAQAASSADKYAHESPWTVVGVAAIAALAIGAAVGAVRR